MFTQNPSKLARRITGIKAAQLASVKHPVTLMSAHRVSNSNETTIRNL